LDCVLQYCRTNVTRHGNYAESQSVNTGNEIGAH
jgi:hypothetical protein